MLPRRGWYLCKHNACKPCGLVVLITRCKPTACKHSSFAALQTSKKTLASLRLAKIVALQRTRSLESLQARKTCKLCNLVNPVAPQVFQPASPTLKRTHPHKLFV